MMNPEPPATCLRSSGVPRRGPKKNSKGAPRPKGEKWFWVLMISVEVIDTTEFRASSAMSAKDGTARFFPATGAAAAVAAGAGAAALSARLGGVRWRDPASTIPKAAAPTAKQSSQKRLF